MEGLSSKEINVISYLELNERVFFSRKDIKKFFKNENEMNVYLYRLMKKDRVIKLSKTKYYLIPVKAHKGHWSEHPFVIVDEIFDGENYYIAGTSAAHYWGLIDQIPTVVEVHCLNKQDRMAILGNKIVFKRQRKLKNHVKKEVKGHPFLILSKEETKKWLSK